MRSNSKKFWRSAITSARSSLATNTGSCRRWVRRKSQTPSSVPAASSKRASSGDLEKLRERALLREFDDYRDSAERRLRVFRLEAVRAGFRRAWQRQDYATIITVAQKIPDAVLQDDPKLLMWYDQAVTRSPESRPTP